MKEIECPLLWDLYKNKERIKRESLYVIEFAGNTISEIKSHNLFKKCQMLLAFIIFDGMTFKFYL